MGSCPACGAPTETGDRFCSACGDVLGGLSLVEDDQRDHWEGGWTGSTSAEPDGPELILLEPAAGGRAASGLRAPDQPSRWIWPVALVAVVLAGLTVWAIGRAGGGQSGSAAADPAEGTAPAGGDAPPVTTRPASAVPTGGTESATPAADAPESGPTGGTSSATDPGVGDIYDSERGGPVLGRPVGWSLLSGSPYDGVMSRFDLDTGEQVQAPDVHGGPVMAIDGKVLMLRSGNGGRLVLRIVPQDQLAADGIEIEVSDSLSVTPWPVTPAGNGTLWVYTSFRDAASWRLIRVRDGRQLDEVAAAPADEVVPVGGAGPDVVSSGSGGVFRRDAGSDRYRLVGQGIPVAVNQGQVLTSNCSAPTVCPMQWLDLDTGRPVERPVPPVGAGTIWGGLSAPSGRFLFGFQTVPDGDPFALQAVVHDLEVGETLMVGTGGSDTEGYAVSPDERYLAVQVGHRLHLYDVERDRWVEVARPAAPGVTVTFVPNGATQ